mmetsp:Transcript_5976/g.16273  ORF Transcript_5976/g.16273 Transcript_5976/m.16273 type:complete len:416 (-) Transcript_5976:81-1328(-)
MAVRHSGRSAHDALHYRRGHRGHHSLWHRDHFPGGTDSTHHRRHDEWQHLNPQGIHRAHHGGDAPREGLWDSHPRLRLRRRHRAGHGRSPRAACDSVSQCLRGNGYLEKRALPPALPRLRDGAVCGAAHHLSRPARVGRWCCGGGPRRRGRQVRWPPRAHWLPQAERPTPCVPRLCHGLLRQCALRPGRAPAPQDARVRGRHRPVHAPDRVLDERRVHRSLWLHSPAGTAVQAGGQPAVPRLGQLPPPPCLLRAPVPEPGPRLGRGPGRTRCLARCHVSNSLPRARRHQLLWDPRLHPGQRARQQLRAAAAACYGQRRQPVSVRPGSRLCAPGGRPGSDHLVTSAAGRGRSVCRLRLHGAHDLPHGVGCQGCAPGTRLSARDACQGHVTAAGMFVTCVPAGSNGNLQYLHKLRGN